MDSTVYNAFSTLLGSLGLSVITLDLVIQYFVFCKGEASKASVVKKLSNMFVSRLLFDQLLFCRKAWWHGQTLPGFWWSSGPAKPIIASGMAAL